MPCCLISKRQTTFPLTKKQANLIQHLQCQTREPACGSKSIQAADSNQLKWDSQSMMATLKHRAICRYMSCLGSTGKSCQDSLTSLDSTILSGAACKIKILRSTILARSSGREHCSKSMIRTRLPSLLKVLELQPPKNISDTIWLTLTRFIRSQIIPRAESRTTKKPLQKVMK